VRYDHTRRALLTPHLGPPLDPAAYDWTLDARCAELSRLAYWRFESEGIARLQAALAAHGLHDVTGFDDGAGGQGFGCVDGQGLAYIAFRGTQPDETRDLLVDAKVWLIDWDGPGKVHRGFWQSFSRLLPQIRSWLARHDQARLVLTGHSLGAALATLMAGLYRESELVTFGSPRVGDGDFAASFAGRMVRRYVDCADLVTKVPPLPYRHLEGECYIDRNGQIAASAPGMLVRLFDQIRGGAAFQIRYLTAENRNLARSLADQAPINYVSAVLGVRAG
jgi:triacylglycerol lipase